MPSDPSRDRLAEALGADADQVVMERGYSLAFVGSQGQARLIQFRLSKKGFSAEHAADELAFAHYLDEFSANVDALLRERWGGIALRAAFDGEGEVIARLFADGPMTRCDAVDPAGSAGVLIEAGEQVDARTLLMRASAKRVEHWGVFERTPALDDGAFAHEQRLRGLVSGTAA